MNERSKKLVELAKEAFSNGFDEGNHPNQCDGDFSTTAVNYKSVYPAPQQLVNSLFENGEFLLYNKDIPNIELSFQQEECSPEEILPNTEHAATSQQDENSLILMNTQPYFELKVCDVEKGIQEMEQAILPPNENPFLVNITESLTSHVQNKENSFQNKVPDVGTNLSEKRKLKTVENKKPSSKKEDIYKSPFLIKNRYKKTICKFCDSEIVSKHFARHIERHHDDEREVKEILNLDKGSLDRKKLLALLRNDGNLESALRGHINPKKRAFGGEISEDDYAMCVHCNGYFKRLCLSRHVKKCFANDSKNSERKHMRPLSESIVYTACKKRYGKLLNKLSVKNEIFSKMQADIITKTAIGDILIVHLGEDLLKKNKVKRSLYHISNKLRECGRFLLEMKKHGEYSDMISTLKPNSFDDAVEAIKNISRYHKETKTFGAASLALHFGTTLKKLTDLATKLILRNRIPDFNQDLEKTLTELKRFRKLVDTQWTTELGSLALKNLNERAAIKPQLLPLTEDIIKLRNFVEDKSSNAYEKLKNTKAIDIYRTLVETTLISTVLHNRKRVGDIQFLDLNSYKDQAVNEINVSKQTELATSLSENEKILTQQYKRIVAIGKGSRAVTILIPKTLQKYFSMIYKIRVNTPHWFSLENSYFFTYPHSNRWIDGCSTIRKYAKICGAKNSELLTSSRLRKHIATVTQVLNLKGNEIDQLAKFMGHPTKTHEQFYKLPQDVYQVAKVSKILQLMEKGNAAQFKNRSLEEIDIDMDNLVEDEDISGSHENCIMATTPKNSKQYKKPRVHEKIDTHKDNLIENSVTTESHETFVVERTSQHNEHQENVPSYLNKSLRNDDSTSSDTDSTFIISDSQSSESESWKEIKMYRKMKISNKINDSESDSEHVPEYTKPITKTKTRQKWSQHQKDLMEKYFSKFTEEHKTPRKLDCEKFISMNKSFTGVAWVKVKTYIYNLYRLK